MDIFENKIVCKNCNKETKKVVSIKDGFKLRALQCPKCKKVWYHPLDIKAFNDFKKMRNKEFRVKLRMVGNSFCVSIPREIIEFEDLERAVNQMIYMSLEEPRKLSLFFTRRRKIY